MFSLNKFFRKNTRSQKSDLWDLLWFQITQRNEEAFRK